MTTKECEDCGRGCKLTDLQCQCGYCFFDTNVRPFDAKRNTKKLPATPETIEEAIELLQLTHNEDPGSNDFVRGYRMGLRLAMNMLINVLLKAEEKE